MKKQILPFFALAFSTLLFAQSKPSFSIRGGITQAGLKGDAVNNLQSLVDITGGAVTTESRTGFFVGGSAAIPVSDMFSIEPGVYYTQRGYGLKGSFSVKGAEFLSANATAQLNTSYIDLPVLAKVNVSGLQLFAGPQVSYLADAKLRTRAGALGFTVLDKTIDAKAQFNQWDLALTGGAGYRFSNGFTINAAYDHGLSKVDNGQNFDSYNRTFKVGVGLTF